MLRQAIRVREAREHKDTQYKKEVYRLPLYEEETRRGSESTRIFLK